MQRNASAVLLPAFNYKYGLCAGMTLTTWKHARHSDGLITTVKGRGCLLQGNKQLGTATEFIRSSMEPVF
ncbi:hypothetical protein [Xenorhabdus bovienii]|uniref:hypothetical protein n=1 Tax=Xenorhabdus bovienii TaxID=40576 RepID=UPI003DA24EC8